MAGKKGTNLGNQNAIKFKTSKERQQLCQNYCRYISIGSSKEYFPECDYDTFQRYCRDFPSDFPTQKIEEAEREGLAKIERLGIRGASGLIPGFNAAAWIFLTKNKLKWRDRHDITSDDERLKGPIVYIPKEYEDEKENEKK